jgi:Zn-dependent alcohol dehydrogenase
MKAKAAVTTGDGTFTIETIDVGHPHDHEVLVEIKAAGVCHTDWDSLSWGDTLVLGHEGAGIIKAIGSQVTHVQPGDPVLLNWAISCGTCFQCLIGNHSLCERDGHAHEGSTQWKGAPIKRSFAIGTMSTLSVIRKEAVVKIDVDVSFASAAIVGCGVMTGYGSAVKAAQVAPGSSVAVIGCGGVGLNVIQGARIAGAEQIIAVDLKPSRLDMARQFGATHFIQSDPDDADLTQAALAVKNLTENRGADYAFEATGNPSLGAAPLKMVRHGGTAIQVSGIEQDLTIDMNLFEWDKMYLNPLYGKCNPVIDFPRLFKLYAKGDLLLDELVTQTYPLEALDRAFADMMSGKNAKGVLLLDPN